MKKVFLFILLIAALFQGCCSSDCVLPIQYMSNSPIPVTQIEIAGNSFLVEIDLGTRMALSLNEDVLEGLKKVPNGTSRRMDFRGNKYETPMYQVGEVKVGGFRCRTVEVRQESDAFVNEGSILSGYCSESDREIARRLKGRIGRDLFDGKNLFMDFGARRFIVCKKWGGCKMMQAVPFCVSRYGIVFEVKTDRGTQHLVLDTGSTVTVLRALTDADRALAKKRVGLPTFTSSQFVMNGVDFGVQDISIVDVSSDLAEIDGFLGMDFLMEHALFLDFGKNIAYIGKGL